MVTRKHELSKKLREILGTPYVYHHKPPAKDMHYPCLIYSEKPRTEHYADNNPYMVSSNWDVTLICACNDGSDKSAGLVDAILGGFKYRRHVQHFETSGFTHDVFQITY